MIGLTLFNLISIPLITIFAYQAVVDRKPKSAAFFTVVVVMNVVAVALNLINC
mgnify:CR=1 FL=1